jgi:ketosteroid isomerase-like protein
MGWMTVFDLNCKEASMKRRSVWILLSLVTAGCTQTVPDLSEADLAAIRQRFDAVAQHVSAEDNAAWANDFTEDAIFMFNHAPAIRGRAAIQEWGETGVVVTNLTFDDVQIHGKGDLAWATSSYSLTMQGVSEPDRGKQLVVLQRQADGSWLTAAAHVSSDLPAPPPPPAATTQPGR